MNSETIQDPLCFARRLLEREGAVIEANPEGFDALLPDELSRRLDLPECVSIVRGSKAGGKEQYWIAYGSPLLEKMVELACETLPLVSCHLSFHYLKSQGFDRLIQDQFSFRKSMCRVISTAPIRTDYLVLACRYVARSDEQKEGIVSLFFHFETGALIPGMSDRPSNVVTEGAAPPESARDSGKWERILKGVVRESQDRIAGEIREFRESMNRRLRRDVNNLEQYYDALQREMALSLRRAGLSDRLVQDRHGKIAMLPEELAKKKEDLLKKYSIRVKITPCAGLFVRSPAVKILCDLLSGREKRPISLIYNPTTKAIDPLVCDGCGHSTNHISFCPRRHVLCSRCRDQCPVCER